MKQLNEKEFADLKEDYKAYKRLFTKYPDGDRLLNKMYSEVAIRNNLIHKCFDVYYFIDTEDLVISTNVLIPEELTHSKIDFDIDVNSMFDKNKEPIVYIKERILLFNLPLHKFFTLDDNGDIIQLFKEENIHKKEELPLEIDMNTAIGKYFWFKMGTDLAEVHITSDKVIIESLGKIEDVSFCPIHNTPLKMGQCIRCIEHNEF